MLGSRGGFEQVNAACISRRKRYLSVCHVPLRDASGQDFEKSYGENNIVQFQ